MRRLTFTLGIVLALALAACGPAEPAPETPAPTETAAPIEPTPAPEPAPAAVAAPLASVTIYRDEWGTPYIYGDDEEAAAFGLGYAVAEDRLHDLLTNILVATGHAAEVFGEDHLQTDFMMRLLDNEGLCRRYFETTQNETTVLCDRLMQGVRAYMEGHPERVPDWAPQVEGWHSVAIGRLMILQWPIGTIYDDYGQRDEAPPFSSNSWVVAPARSAEGCAILLTDPHLTWEGVQVMYEARVHGGNLHQNGFFLVGAPFAGVGHNNDVGWGCTTGGPDTSDVYMVKINEKGEYEYEGQWRPLEVKEIKVPVKDKLPVTLPVFSTHLGWLVPDPEGKNPDMEKMVAYVARSPYWDDMGLLEQMHQMVLAKNAQEFHAALGMNHFMEQNNLFADREGNIGYVRTGRVPIRPEGYDWSKPVPGNTAATEWKGIHPVEDLVQTMNPPQGYFQNCNISPANMMLDSPMTPDKYLPYIFNVSWDLNNPRGKRSVQVLSQDDSMTKEEATALALDVYDILADPWKKAVAEAAAAQAAVHADKPALAKAVEAIAVWDGRYTADSTGATLMKALRLKAQDAVDTVAIAQGGALSAEDQTRLLERLVAIADEFQGAHGAVEVPWGAVHKIGRSDRYFPASGADYGDKGKETFTETLFDVESKETPKGSGQLVAYSGSMATVLMFFHKEGIESYSVSQWGQSEVPESPHHVDQSEQLYGPLKMKRCWWTREEAVAHAQSEETLELP